MVNRLLRKAARVLEAETGSKLKVYIMTRYHITVYDCSVALEEGFSREAIAELEKRGHKVAADIKGHARGIFGRGQIIQQNPKTGVLWGGTDPRADGAIYGW